MRFYPSFIILIAFKLLCLIANGATYYVAQNGSDTNAGTSAAPFKTFSKANAAMNSGDTCIVKDGTYWQTLTITKSGVQFRAENPKGAVIEPRKAINNWTAVAGSTGQYVADCTGVVEDEYMQVYHNNQPQNWARWPNDNDYDEYTFDSSNVVSGTLSSIVVSGLPVNVEGAYVRYLAGHSGVSWTKKLNGFSQVNGGQQVTFNAVDASKWPWATHNPTQNQAYRLNGTGEAIFFGKKNLLDAEREWFYDRPNGKLYFRAAGSGKPANWTVKVPIRKHCIEITGNSVIVDGFKMLGGNVTMSGNYGTLKNCLIQHGRRVHDLTGTGTFNDASVFVTGSDNRIEGNTIEYGTVNGVSGSAWQGEKNTTIIKNTIRNFNTVAIHAGCVRLGGDGSLITENRMYDSGRGIITFFGKDVEISYNHINNGMRLTADGGLIYTVGVKENGAVVRKNGKIHHNWIHAAPSLTYLDNVNAHYLAPGVYLDNHSAGYDVYDNAIFHVRGSAVQVNWENELVWIYNNTAWDISDYDANNNYVEGYFFKRWANGYTAQYNRVWNNYANTPNSEAHGGYWRSNNIFEDVSTEPFVSINWQNRDFTPKSGSVLVDTGRTDASLIDQNVFGSGADVGAVELGGTNWKPGIWPTKE
ncbi:MAG: right-handed parallel beta-helix repeat-containing protein [Opitutaceae bacterium]